MVILKLSKPASSEFECEEVDVQKQDANLIRPCERYMELYKSCSSIRNRIQQYYVDGEIHDCQPIMSNYKACMQYRATRDHKLLDSIITWERNIINRRLKSVEQNTAWEYRQTPPEDFESELPDFIKRKQKSSIFKNEDARVL